MPDVASAQHHLAGRVVGKGRGIKVGQGVITQPADGTTEGFDFIRKPMSGVGYSPNIRRLAQAQVSADFDFQHLKAIDPGNTKARRVSDGDFSVIKLHAAVNRVKFAERRCIQVHFGDH